MTLVATDTQELIGTICRQFSDATGWPLGFTLAERDRDAQAMRLRRADNCVWMTEIDDGQAVVGWLHLGPHDERSACSFVQATDLATGIGRLLSRLSDATHRLESRTREVSTLADLGTSVRGTESLAEALAELLRAAAELSGYRSSAFFLLDPGTSRLTLRAAWQIAPHEIPEPSRTVASSHPDLQALSNGPVQILRAAGDDNPWLPAQMASSVCVPVQSAEIPIGTLWVYDRRTHKPASHEFLVLKSVATRIAALLERLVLLKESETQHRLSSELRVACENQTNPLADAVPATPGFQVAARCVSRHELGGDLCEVIALGEQVTGIALGDASGNSIPAALVMTAVRGALKTLSGKDAAGDIQPARVMQRLNRSLHAITGPHQFMSLFYGIFDGSTRRLTYTNAGHPSPLLYRDGRISALESHGLLLGVLDDVEYEFAVLDLQPGDILVLFSDGISESMNAQQELFKSEGIVAAMRHSRTLLPSEVLESIWNAAEQHSRSGPGVDDRSLLVLRIVE
ncbi:MAG TPA: GAF domain-containing SpoIIE family protein phosphatase [Planctomycetaceae bacterium]|nr:GAF domain-containing SpoIIE family protein phosphatase [Planctomycetaceae bacterium]